MQKGQTERKVIFQHALKNAMIPIITVLGSMFGSSLGGALIIETIFSIPGMGTYLTDAISKRDYPIIQGGVLFISICFCLIMLIVDIIYAFVGSADPIPVCGQRKEKAEKGGTVMKARKKKSHTKEILHRLFKNKLQWRDLWSLFYCYWLQFLLRFWHRMAMRYRI